MRPVAVRLTTVSGAWLFKRAKALAARLLKTRMWGSNQVIDGYLLKATLTAGTASAVVYDPPGTLAMGYKGFMPVGARDNYNSRVASQDGPYDADGDSVFQRGALFLPIGFTDGEVFNTSIPLESDEFFVTKKDVLRSHGLRRVPANTTAYPLRPPVAVFSGVFNRGYTEGVTPGFYWADDAVLDKTGGYGLARIADMDYLIYEYQGDAPVSASNGQYTLVVMPVVKNFETSEAEGCVHWGHSGVLFVLMQTSVPITTDTPVDQLPVEVWRYLWTPDSHSSSFFHNGPWQARPDYPNFDAIPPGPLRPPTVQAWDDWWELPRPVPAGGSRPNWTDALSVTWFNGRFVVNLKVNSLNGTYTAGTPATYKTAGGSACMRFDVPLDGAVVATEGSYEIWNSPAEYGGDPTGTPFAQWVDGFLDVATVRCVNPATTMTTERGLVEVTWRAEADRTDVVSSSGVPRYLANRDSVRFEVKVTGVSDLGVEQTPVVYPAVFSAVGAGLLGPVFPDFAGGARLNLNPPTRSYKMRGMDPYFVVLSDREIAFVGYPDWDALAQNTTGRLAVINLDTGAAELRSNIPVDMVTTVSHMLATHMDCIQQTKYDADDNVVLEGVLLVTSRLSDEVVISRDSGRTWDTYVNNVGVDERDLRYAYYIGNPLGGGTRSGRAVE